MQLPARRTAALVAALVASLLLTASTAVAAPRLKEFSLRADFAVPSDIAPGPDGALYAPDGSLGVLWRITTAGRVSSIDVGVGPAGVTTGPDGALWVTDRSLGRVSRVTPDGAVTAFPLPTPGAFPTDIVAGPDGALWMTDARQDRIARVTTGGAVTEYPLPTANAWAGDIIVGPDGALWFTEGGADKVGRISTTGQITEYAMPAGSLPGPIVASGGDLLVALRNTNAIVRVSTAGEITATHPLPTEHANPLSMVAAPDGELWFSQHSAGTLGRMTPEGVFGEATRVRSAPDAVTIGPDGALWYVSGNEGKVGRLRLDG